MFFGACVIHFVYEDVVVLEVQSLLHFSLLTNDYESMILLLPFEVSPYLLHQLSWSHPIYDFYVLCEMFV